jgi:hypothetical protein
MFLSTPAFTLLHVVLSLIGIASGAVVLIGLLKTKRFDGWTGVFLSTTALTSLTGFLFPFHQFLPSHAVGIISLLVLAIAAFARYAKHLAGAWRRLYAAAASISLYLNVFVLIAQLFQKVTALKAIAPTQAAAPFVVSQTLALILFAGLTIAVAIRFRTAPGSSGAAPSSALH